MHTSTTITGGTTATVSMWGQNVAGDCAAPLASGIAMVTA
jgi:hypothetical protein